MPTNEYLEFARGTSPHVESQSSYSADSDRQTGQDVNTVASNTLYNKALRQCSAIAAMIAQFVVNAGMDMLDAATQSTLVANFTAAINDLIDTAISSLGNAVNKTVTNNSLTYIASVDSPVAAGHVAVFADDVGTIEDGGPLPVGANAYAFFSISGGAITVLQSFGISTLTYIGTGQINVKLNVAAASWPGIVSASCVGRFDGLEFHPITIGIPNVPMADNVSNFLFNFWESETGNRVDPSKVAIIVL